MIYKTARVIRLEGQLAVLHVSRQSACDTCAAKSGCGTSVLSQLFGKSSEFRAYNPIHAVAGDKVSVSIPESILLKASVMMYLVPLLLLVSFAVLGPTLGQILFPQLSEFAELLSIMFGVAGMVVGIFLYRRFAARIADRSESLPTLVRHINSNHATIAITTR